MRAIDYIEEAINDFSLNREFVRVEQQILREETVAEVSLRSDTLKIMIKLFISEMEGEGGVYVAPLNTPIGFREKPSWIDEWTLFRRLKEEFGIDLTPLAALPLSSPGTQLYFSLKWLHLNLSSISNWIVKPTSTPQVM